jgi:uncharacterized membrane protein YdbT with pleckstrin-like domain
MKATGYTKQAVVKDESVVYKGSVSPVIYIPPALFLVPGVFLSMSEDRGIVFWGVLLIAIGSYMLLRRLLVAVTTEYAITSKRVILKTGLVSRNTLELLHSKIDSVAISQGIFGRILGYGTLTVGVATEKSSFPYLSNPSPSRKK